MCWLIVELMIVKLSTCVCYKLLTVNYRTSNLPNFLLVHFLKHVGRLGGVHVCVLVCLAVWVRLGNQ